MATKKKKTSLSTKELKAGASLAGDAAVSKAKSLSNKVQGNKVRGALYGAKSTVEGTAAKVLTKAGIAGKSRAVSKAATSAKQTASKVANNASKEIKRAVKDPNQVINKASLGLKKKAYMTKRDIAFKADGAAVKMYGKSLANRFKGGASGTLAPTVKGIAQKHVAKTLGKIGLKAEGSMYKGIPSLAKSAAQTALSSNPITAKKLGQKAGTAAMSVGLQAKKLGLKASNTKMDAVQGARKGVLNASLKGGKAAAVGAGKAIGKTYAAGSNMVNKGTANQLKGIGQAIVPGGKSGKMAQAKGIAQDVAGRGLKKGAIGTLKGAIKVASAADRSVNKQRAGVVKGAISNVGNKVMNASALAAFRSRFAKRRARDNMGQFT